MANGTTNKVYFKDINDLEDNQAAFLGKIQIEKTGLIAGSKVKTRSENIWFGFK
jgi:hypothetical protein